MKVYDISQEVFGSEVYPGDPEPKKESLSSIGNGDLYNLTAFSMCAHNGTHIDAPYHFIEDGKTVDEIPVEKFVGPCFVSEYEGIIGKEEATEILKKANEIKRILIKGKAVISEEAAECFVDGNIILVGNEFQTVGPEDAPMAVHKELLGAEIILLEGVRLGDVPEGEYILVAAPLLLKGADGSPCRAILIKYGDM